MHYPMFTIASMVLPPPCEARCAQFCPPTSVSTDARQGLGVYWVTLRRPDSGTGLARQREDASRWARTTLGIGTSLWIRVLKVALPQTSRRIDRQSTTWSTYQRTHST